jgi:hypothetical protein
MPPMPSLADPAPLGDRPLPPRLRATQAETAKPKLDPNAVLSPKQRRQAGLVARAYAQGNSMAVLDLLSPLVAQLDPDHVAALDQLLADGQAPPAAEIIADAHLGMVYQGFANKLHRAKEHETLLLLPELHRRLIAILQEHDGHTIKDEPLPAPPTIEDYETLFWSVHVLKNRLLNAERMCQYGVDLTKSFPRAHLAKLKGDAKTAVETDYGKLLADVRRRIKDVEERTIEMRIARLHKTVDLLADREISKERFLAAFAADMDERLIEEFLGGSAKDKRKRGAFARQRLNQPGVLEAVKADGRRAAELGGELTGKAKQLFAGLHWWLRGRYGLGPDAMGLAKSVAAMDWPDAQLWLFMPPEMPKPTSPNKITASETPVPRFDRRHHYWWAWEDRHLQHAHFGNTQVSTQVNDRGDAGGGKNVQIALTNRQKDTPFW